MPRFVRLTALAALLLVAALARGAGAQDGGRLFLETGYSVREPFLSAWRQAGLQQLGYPISPELQEQHREDGLIYTVQYFERARLELHPDAVQPIQFGRLGAELMTGTLMATPAPEQSGDCTYFAETGQALCGSFAAFWSERGGLAAFGYPITPLMLQADPTGQAREVQYTERARLERAPGGWEVQLGLLGRERYVAPPDVAPPLFTPVLPWEAQQVVDLINQERAAVGLAPLRVAPELMAAAQGHSQSMADSGLISHTGADGRGPAQRIADAGYRWQRCGENIAVGQTTPAEVLAFWMGSPPHRANILDPGMQELGVGYVWQPGGYSHYWTLALGER